jgi:predicted AAA+ superfamily ATPase
MISREYEPLDSYLQPNKVLVIYGPRQVGKTTLLNQFLAQTSLHYKSDTGDDIRVQQLLGSQDLAKILGYIEGYQLLALDEAQQIPMVGTGLKIIVDHIPGIKVIATGSSSFELAGQIGEPLTGRKRTICLFPIAQCELLRQYNRFELGERLPEFLIYGSYPEVVETTSLNNKRQILNEITNSYLLKDVLSYDRVKNSRVLLNLLQLLAFQVGNEVSLSELASQVSADLKTVQRYIDLLEKAFVLQRLGGFSRNLRDEVTSKAKYYFYDTGIRNALVAQFNPLELRSDVGALWENFIFMERLKYRTYQQIDANSYFWHTYRGHEIDLIEVREGKLDSYEIKWSPQKGSKPPAKWASAYPEASYQVITPQNYMDFIT